MIRLSTLNIKEIERKGHWKYSDPEITGVETSSLRIEKGIFLLLSIAKLKRAMEQHLVIKLLKKVQVLSSLT